MGVLRSAAYWQGVKTVVTTRARLDALRLARVPPPPSVDLDLANGIGAAERILATQPASGARLSFGATVLGEISPRPDAESLRLPHLVRALQQEFATLLLPLVAPDLWNRPSDP